MTKWIELREKIRKIYGKHNRLILAVVKFILALFLFLLINQAEKIKKTLLWEAIASNQTRFLFIYLNKD